MENEGCGTSVIDVTEVAVVSYRRLKRLPKKKFPDPLKKRE